MNAWTENPHVAREKVRAYLLGDFIQRVAEVEQKIRLKSDRLVAFAMGDDTALTKYDIVVIHLLYVKTESENSHGQQNTVDTKEKTIP